MNRRDSSPIKGKYYGFSELRARGIRLSLVAIRRKNSYPYRLYRELKEEPRYWLEGPFGPRNQVGYVYLAESPSPSQSMVQGDQYWRHRYPSYYAMLGNDQMEGLGTDLSPKASSSQGQGRRFFESFEWRLLAEHWQHREVLNYLGVWKSKIFIWLGFLTLLGLWIMTESGYASFENVLTLGFGFMALLVVLFVYILLPI